MPTQINSWPTFSPYLYNRVWSELTCCNSLSHSRLACSRLSAHIQPSVNNPDTNGAANSVVVSIYNGHELSWSDHCLQWNKLATLVYSTVDSGLTYASKMILTAARPDNWKRPPGRPRITWLNSEPRCDRVDAAPDDCRWGGHVWAVEAIVQNDGRKRHRQPTPRSFFLNFNTLSTTSGNKYKLQKSASHYT